MTRFGRAGSGVMTEYGRAPRLGVADEFGGFDDFPGGFEDVGDGYGQADGGAVPDDPDEQAEGPGYGVEGLGGRPLEEVGEHRDPEGGDGDDDQDDEGWDLFGFGAGEQSEAEVDDGAGEEGDDGPGAGGGDLDGGDAERVGCTEEGMPGGDGGTADFGDEIGRVDGGFGAGEVDAAVGAVGVDDDPFADGGFGAGRAAEVPVAVEGGEVRGEGVSEEMGVDGAHLVDLTLDGVTHTLGEGGRVGALVALVEPVDAFDDEEEKVEAGGDDGEGREDATPGEAGGGLILWVHDALDGWGMLRPGCC